MTTIRTLKHIYQSSICLKCTNKYASYQNTSIRWCFQQSLAHLGAKWWRAVTAMHPLLSKDWWLQSFAIASANSFMSIWMTSSSFHVLLRNMKYVLGSYSNDYETIISSLVRVKLLFTWRDWNASVSHIDDWGIHVDADKMQHICEWRCPRTFNDVQHFLGLVQYLAHYMRDISAYITPLSGCVRNGHPFEWTPLSDKCFESIKTLVCRQ